MIRYPRRMGLVLWVGIVALAGMTQGGMVPDGQGSASLPDSSVYKGEFTNGLFNGKGTLARRDGCSYTGEFKDGLMHGQDLLESHNYLCGYFFKWTFSG